MTFPARRNLRKNRFLSAWLRRPARCYPQDSFHRCFHSRCCRPRTWVLPPDLASNSRRPTPAAGSSRAATFAARGSARTKNFSTISELTRLPAIQPLQHSGRLRFSTHVWSIAGQHRTPRRWLRRRTSSVSPSRAIVLKSELAPATSGVPLPAKSQSEVLITSAVDLVPLPPLPVPVRLLAAIDPFVSRIIGGVLGSMLGPYGYSLPYTLYGQRIGAAAAGP